MGGRMTTYAVTLSREEQVWVAVVAGLAGGTTETRQLDHLEADVRDLIASLTDADAGSFDLTWEYAPRPAVVPEPAPSAR
jgi:hypothetical protein